MAKSDMGILPPPVQRVRWGSKFAPNNQPGVPCVSGEYATLLTRAKVWILQVRCKSRASQV